MAFSQEDAANPPLSSAWWKTRAHHAPLGVRTKEYQKLVEAIQQYENAIFAGDIKNVFERCAPIRHFFKKQGGFLSHEPADARQDVLRPPFR